MTLFRISLFEPTTDACKLVACACVFMIANVAAAAGKYVELDEARIEALAALLPEKPEGFGRPIEDRAFWSRPEVEALARPSLGKAGKLLGQAFPGFDEILYLDFSVTGQRLAGERMLRARDGWLHPLVMAECLENKGRFLPRIHEVLRGFAGQPTWTLPAHDRQLLNFKRKTYEVDLASAAHAAKLAQAVYLLGGKLDAGLRGEVLAALEIRVFAPVRRSLENGRGSWWLGNKGQPVQNNWNAVCLAGVVGAARAVLPERRDRAAFLAAGEHYSRYFLNGFRDDGYCDEGYGYWAYGFGNYLVLREILMTSTGGKLDLLAHPKTAAVAMYGAGSILVDGLVPNFADCRTGTKANSQWVGYCNHVMRLGLEGFALSKPPCGQDLSTVFLGATPMANGVPGRRTVGRRSYFDQAGVLVCRPAGTARMAVAIKAGGNSSHSHNDVGSFVIALDGSLPAGDPGGPHAYNSETFSDKRYTYNILNSFGHPVPAIDGKLQLDATRVTPRVMATRFSDMEDEIVIDMKPAYDVPGLRVLKRRMVYSRLGAGQVVVEDTMEAERPLAFEWAVPTPGTCRRIDDKTLEFTAGKARMRASVECPVGFGMTTARVEELGAPAFERVGLKLEDPLSAVTVKVIFRPDGAP